MVELATARDGRGLAFSDEDYSMRLNIGCGNRLLPGYTGVDVVARAATDIIAPADSIPLGDGVADEIISIHLVEHLLPWNLPVALKEWARLLKRGGLLVIEAPDLFKACANIVEGRRSTKHPDQLGMFALYGDVRQKDEYMLHRYAYSFVTIRPLVRDAGFGDITEHTTKFHPVGREHRDFRLEARKL